ncbi:MAG: twin-arginine translocation signal domain-containing protein [Pirellulales bacterium]|nr:twin-arginine translocation signal domain-containing protein [Pirellulales bacterium]
MLRSFISATTTGQGVASRRGFLKTLLAGAAAGAVMLSTRAADVQADTARVAENAV